MHTYTAIVLAAGQGKRLGLGFNKQLLTLAGVPMIIHTLRLFARDEACANMIIVAREEEREQLAALVKQYDVPRVQCIITGGAERQDSVYAGLQVAKTALVLIHDGARPFTRQAVLRGLVNAAVETGAAIAAVPVKDTIKRVKSGVIEETIERAPLWAAQTPQAFQLPLIWQAHKEARATHFIGTDDASLVERLGREVAIVPSDDLNMKVTTPADVKVAEAILTERGHNDD
ncbi:2-C-methyl-D-erythritol 4-phosphate cytidylyltransferase [Bacillus sp. FSL W7-1360]